MTEVIEPTRAPSLLPVVMEIPPEASYLPVLRTAVVTTAARVDFTLDDIEDLRIAVSEVAALVLKDVQEDSPLRCSLVTDGEVLRVEVSARTSGVDVDRSSFAWMILESLAGEVTADLDGDTLTLVITKRRGGALA